MTAMAREPQSVRRAAAVIVLATVVVVVAAGVVMWALDHREYPNVGRGMWWALQTVTTVGYGDVTPRRVVGRVIGALVMLWGIAFLTVLVASITSTFIARIQRERDRADAEEERRLDVRLDDLAARLDRIEQSLSRRAN
jgi:voltage-gated potassium channel